MAFAIEIVLRLSSITVTQEFSQPLMGRLRDSLTFFAIVDLASVSPLVCAMAGVELPLVSAAQALRLFELARYSRAMRSLATVFVAQRREVVAAMSVLAGYWAYSSLLSPRAS